MNGDENDYEDDLLVTFEDNATVVRNAIEGFFPSELMSNLPREMGLKLTSEEDQGDEVDKREDVHVEVDGYMESNVTGVFVVGDANS